MEPYATFPPLKQVSGMAYRAVPGDINMSKGFKFILASTLIAAAIPVLALRSTSGLQPGERVSPFHPQHLAGPLANTENCFPCTFQNRPQAQLWVNGDNAENVLKVAKKLNKAMKDHSDKEFKALVVFVTNSNNEAKIKQMVLAAAKNPELDKVGMAILDKDNEAVSSYKFNTDGTVKNTLLTYKNWKVTKNFTNFKADDEGLKALDSEINKIIG